MTARGENVVRNKGGVKGTPGSLEGRQQVLGDGREPASRLALGLASGLAPAGACWLLWRHRRRWRTPSSGGGGGEELRVGRTWPSCCGARVAMATGPGQRVFPKRFPPVTRSGGHVGLVVVRASRGLGVPLARRAPIGCWDGVSRSVQSSSVVRSWRDVRFRRTTPEHRASHPTSRASSAAGSRGGA